MARIPHIVIIADDLTGAADTGVAFAQAGRVVVIGMAPAGPCPECDVLVLTTESRDASREEAVARVREACRRSPTGESVWIYKKIDSTLRGHPAAELAVIMDVMRIERALAAPAFPAQGRTTVGGRQRLDGMPVERTPSGAGVASSDLIEIFRKEAGGREVRLLDLAGVRRGAAEALLGPGTGIVVADAETDGDLFALARAAIASGVRLFCGSAGLAHALARARPQMTTAPLPKPAPSPSGPVLVVAGSRHPKTTRQVEFAARQGAVVVCLSQAFLGGEDDALARISAEAAGHLRAGRDVILTAAGTADGSLGGRAVAGRLAQTAKRLVAAVGGMVLTGGDIAAAVCEALEVSAIQLDGEVQPGMPLCLLVGGLGRGLRVVTKAGGFGGEESISAAIRCLSATRRVV
jgi:4-hydroxythreonine-4-phosphate dehydrogenase